MLYLNKSENSVRLKLNATTQNHKGAIQIIRDTFWPYFRPLLPYVSFGDTGVDLHPHPPTLPRGVTWHFFQK